MLLEHDVNYGLGMDALDTVCSRNTNGIMVWAWMLWSAYAHPTQTESWFGHGCSGYRMLSEHERNYGLGTDALVSICSSNTNGIMVWAWMSPLHRMLSEHDRKYGLGMGALVSVHDLPTRTESWFGHRCSGHCMLLEHDGKYGLGMDAPVTVCSRNTSGIMVWAWMLWSVYALGTQWEVRFGHGCSGHRMLSEHERFYGLHGCSCQRMLFQHERNYGLGMDALVTVCSRNTNGFMVWAWMLWSAYMIFQHERNYGLGMDALVTVCSRNTNGSMVWERMLRSAYALPTQTE